MVIKIHVTLPGLMRRVLITRGGLEHWDRFHDDSSPLRVYHQGKITVDRKYGLEISASLSTSEIRASNEDSGSESRLEIFYGFSSHNDWLV